MNVIKEALDYLAKLQTPKNPISVEVHGEPYAVKPDGTIGEHIRKPDATRHPDSLTVRTLSALVAAYTAAIDGLDPATVAVHIVDPFQVEVIDIDSDDFGYRHTYIEANHTPDARFPFNQYVEPETFLIQFRASFYFNDDAVKVQKLCSSLESGSTVSVADDGMSQTVVITTGTINKAPVTLPAEGVPLIPWRTFRDAAPVESKFLLRMKTAKDSLPKIALFEIDDKWKLDTVASIHTYLTEKLPQAIII